MNTLDALHQQMRVMWVEELKLRIAGDLEGAEKAGSGIDELLAKCLNNEYCEQCGSIFCPWGEPLHFHHDGCPACSLDWKEGKDYSSILLKLNS